MCLRVAELRFNPNGYLPLSSVWTTQSTVVHLACMSTPYLLSTLSHFFAIYLYITQGVPFVFCLVFMPCLGALAKPSLLYLSLAYPTLAQLRSLDGSPLLKQSQMLLLSWNSVSSFKELCTWPSESLLSPGSLLLLILVNSSLFAPIIYDCLSRLGWFLSRCLFYSGNFLCKVNQWVFIELLGTLCRIY